MHAILYIDVVGLLKGIEKLKIRGPDVSKRDCHGG